MRKSKMILASCCALAMGASSISAHAQERDAAPVSDSEELGGGPAISAVGWVLAIALAVTIAVVILDDDEDLPTSP